MKPLLLKKYLNAEHYINQGLIRQSVPEIIPGKRTRREWMLNFLGDLGHPERAFPAVHIAGTSGKGSTAMMIAEILRAAGYRVGLHTTPYLQVAAEKIWVNGKYASAREFIDLVEWIKPICEKWRSAKTPLHGMASFGLCLEYFRRHGLDIAVIETGVGGRDDLTNVLNTSLSVITPIGIDHTKTLGPSIEEITRHKAGIIREDTNIVACRGEGAETIEELARKKNAPVTWVSPTSDIIFDTGMKGGFQNINANIAASAASILDIAGFHIPKSSIVAGIGSARLPARMERVHTSPDVIIDGAHNCQKLEALLKHLGGDKIKLIVGMVETKISDDIISLFKNYDSQIIFTKPHVYGKDPFDFREIPEFKGSNDYLFIDDPAIAVNETISSSSNNEKIVVTGSLYLAGNVREIFYPSEEVLEARSSWPV